MQGGDGYRKGITTWGVIAFVLLLAVPAFAQQRPAPQTKMYAYLLGTGFPHPDPDHAGPSTAVIVGDKVFLVDAGRGAMQRLVAAGLESKGIRAVFLTHLHSDHVDGLPDVYHATWRNRGNHPFQVYGPEGTKDLADGLTKFYGADIHIRRDLTEKLPAGGEKMDVHLVNQGVVYEDENVRVTAFLVDHWPVVPAFGYRFDSGGRSIVISGDTHPNDNLVRFAKGADVLIHEAYLVRGSGSGAQVGRTSPNASAAPTSSVFPPGGGPPVGPNAGWFQRYHSSAAEAGQDAARAEVKMLVLTHLIPNRIELEARYQQQAARNYQGVIIVGRDLMRIDLPEAQQ